MQTRRRFITALGLIVPATLLAKKAKAFEIVSADDAGLPKIADGVWATLAHVTDGSDPSTALSAPGHFTPEMRALAGQHIELTGYIQSLGTGFGKRQYLLSRQPLHCMFCYPGGRGSLALVETEAHIAETASPVTVTGLLALQEKEPDDFYFQLKDAKIKA